MTKKIFPPEFESMANNPNVKLTMYGFGVAVNPIDCENCGGWGFMAIFIAKKGPFRNPSNGMDEIQVAGEKGKVAEVNKWHNGRWWIGQNFSYPCPVCQGSGVKPDYVEEFKPLHTLRMMKELAKDLATQKEGYHEPNYVTSESEVE